MAQSLRVMELSFFIAAVNQTSFAVTNNPNALHGFFVYNNKPIVGSIWDYNKILSQSILSLNANNFTWVLQLLGFGILELQLNLFQFNEFFIDQRLLLLLRLDFNWFLMVKAIVVEVIGNWYEQIKNLSHTLPIQH